MSRIVGAFLSPRGVSVIEGRVSGKGIEVARSFDHPARVSSERQAADLLLRVLQDAGVRKANIVLTLRGFGIVHHVLSLPPARDELLSPIAERELKRLEPQLDDPCVGWLGLPTEGVDMTDAPPQRQVLAAALPRHVAELVSGTMEAAGHKLVHLTALPAAAQRLHETFVPDRTPTALILPLNDGAFLGFFLGGAVRLVVEPPIGDDEHPDAAGIAEEAELGAMFVRQQFRGAQISRSVLAAAPGTFVDVESALGERLGVPTGRINVQQLSPGALAALGGVIDSRAQTPLSLLVAQPRRAGSALKPISYAAVALAAVIGVLTGVEAFRARDAHTELHNARQQIDAEAFGLASIRETAGQRRLIRDAVDAMRLSEHDRRELQNGLSTLGGMIVAPVLLDSLRLDRGTNGWVSEVAGRVEAGSTARSVELLNEFYRSLPRRLGVEELSLGQLSYADGVVDSDPGTVRFQLSFVLPYSRSR